MPNLKGDESPWVTAGENRKGITKIRISTIIHPRQGTKSGVEHIDSMQSTSTNSSQSKPRHDKYR